MAAVDDPWETIPDDKRIYLTKSDIDGIMTSMLHVQLVGIYASGLIRALKEGDDGKYDDLWSKLKIEVFASREHMASTLKQIGERNKDEVDA